MKNIFLLFAMLILAFSGYAQPGIPLGSKDKTVEVLGTMKIDSGGIQLPMMDTSRRNKNSGFDTVNAVIAFNKADSCLYILRNKKWYKLISTRDSVAGVTTIGGTITGAVNGEVFFAKGNKLYQDKHFYYDTLTKSIFLRNDTGGIIAFITSRNDTGIVGTQIPNSPNTGVQMYTDASSGISGVRFIGTTGHLDFRPPASFGGNFNVIWRNISGIGALLSDLATTGTWIKIATKTFSDFSTAGTDITIASGYLLPAKGVITGTMINATTKFSGGGITQYTISVGGATLGDPTKYAVAQNVFTGAQLIGPALQGGMESFSTTGSITISAHSAGANLDAATAGVVDIYIYVAIMP